MGGCHCTRVKWQHQSKPHHTHHAWHVPHITPSCLPCPVCHALYAMCLPCPVCHVPAMPRMPCPVCHVPAMPCMPCACHALYSMCRIPCACSVLHAMRHTSCVERPCPSVICPTHISDVLQVRGCLVPQGVHHGHGNGWADACLTQGSLASLSAHHARPGGHVRSSNSGSSSGSSSLTTHAHPG